jgi:DNA-directed RNA polymerase alpha subunit
MVRLLPQRLAPCVTEPADHALRCLVRCPGFWEANLLRRGLLTTIHVLACQSVHVRSNTSKVEDWCVAHRLGQLAICGPAIEARAAINVRDRPVRGEDICFMADMASVADGDLNAPIVDLNAGEAFQADLFFTRGTPVEHAKFHSVASPSYEPVVHAERSLTDHERTLLADFEIDEELRCARKDGAPVRIEVLREAAPDVPFAFGKEVTLGVESLGQVSAAETIQLAKAGLVQDAEELYDMIELVCKERPGISSQHSVSHSA